MDSKKCCICKKTFLGWGNNPWPVNMDDKATCCDTCNMEIVLPARIVMLQQRKEKNDGKN